MLQERRHSDLNIPIDASTSCCPLDSVRLTTSTPLQLLFRHADCRVLAPSSPYGKLSLTAAAAAAVSQQQQQELPSGKNQSRTKGQGVGKAPVVGKKRRRKVQFAKTASVKRLMIRKEQRSAMWYKPQDYVSFEQDVRQTLAVMDQSQGNLTTLNPDQFCLQGLEHQLTRQQVITRKLHAMRLTRAILEQQHFQRQAGSRDPATLRAVSLMFSEPASQRAHMKAVLHHALQQQSTDWESMQRSKNVSLA